MSKYVYLIITVLCSAIVGRADILKVKEMTELTRDISARVNPYFTADGTQCALVRVLIVGDNAVFQGEIVHIDVKPNQYDLYVSSNINSIEIGLNGDKTTVNFADYAITLESKMSYQLLIENAHDNGGSFSTLIYDPNDADIKAGCMIFCSLKDRKVRPTTLGTIVEASEKGWPPATKILMDYYFDRSDYDNYFYYRDLKKDQTNALEQAVWQRFLKQSFYDQVPAEIYFDYDTLPQRTVQFIDDYILLANELRGYQRKIIDRPSGLLFLDDGTGAQTNDLWAGDYIMLLMEECWHEIIKSAGNITTNSRQTVRDRIYHKGSLCSANWEFLNATK